MKMAAPLSRARSPDPAESKTTPCLATVACPPGMSLRDYFAGQALLGLLSAGRFGPSTDHSEMAYKHADQMLARREIST